MPRRTPAFAVSGLGRHTPKSIPKDLNVDPHFKDMNENISSKIGMDESIGGKFKNADKFHSNLNVLMEGLRFANKLRTGVTPNDVNGLLHGGVSLLTYITGSETSNIGQGKSNCIYHKTYTHVGKKTSRRIKEFKKNAFIEKVTKSFSDTNSDYLTHRKRSQLHTKGGYNEKTFTFFLEDTFFTVKDYYDLYKIEKRFLKDLKDSDGDREIHGCALKTHFQLKIKNRTKLYSSHVKIHVIRVTDHGMDMKELLKQITSNDLVTSASKIGKLPIDLQYTDPILESINGKESGNRSLVSFTTDLRCNLNQSSKYKESVNTVLTLQKTLGAGSIWEFNLTQHLGKGINLNRIYDFIQTTSENDINEKESEQASLLEKAKNEMTNIFKNELEQLKTEKTIQISKENLKTLITNTGTSFVKEMIKDKVDSPKKTLNKSLHPIGYVVCLECVGDRRATIQRMSDNDLFGGYSPTHLSYEFSRHMSYLTEQDKEDELLVYKRIRQDRNFEDGTDFQAVFNPARQEKLHVPYDKILMTGMKGTFPYRMDYDELIQSGGTDELSFLDSLKKQFTDLGLDPSSAMEDDHGLNFDKNPSTEEEVYGGPDMPPPTVDDLDNLDLDNPKG